MSTDVRNTPDASAFGPDRLELFVLLNDMVNRVECNRDSEALMLARYVSQGESQVWIDAACERFREADRQHQALVARFIAFVL